MLKSHNSSNTNDQNSNKFRRRYDNDEPRVCGCGKTSDVERNWKGPIRHYEHKVASTENQTNINSLEPSEKAREMAERYGPVLDVNVVQDLKYVFKGRNVKQVNEYRRKMVEDMFHKTRKLIEEAADTYTPEFFVAKMEQSHPDVPDWKKLLLARKKSQQVLSEYEKNAWDEFLKWKKTYSPSVKLNPDFNYKLDPKLH